MRCFRVSVWYFKTKRVLHLSQNIVDDNEVYFLSFGVPAKSDIAKDLNEGDDIGRKADDDFIDSLLGKNLSFTTP